MRSSLAINLRRFRKILNLTQQQLAEKSGISRNAYRSIESGDAEPRLSTLNAVAKALRVSVFELTANIPQLNAVRFRSLKSLTASERAEKQQIKVDVANWLNDFNELERLLRESIPYRFGRIDLAGTDPKKAASKARKALEVEDCEIIGDICRLLESAGIKIMQLESKLKRFFGLSVGLDDGGPAIVVNKDSSIPVERQIFSTAHELGHLLLHIASYGGDQESEDEKEEYEANVFASYFLMPQHYFERIWTESRGLHWVDRVLSTKRRFRVSYKTVLRRLIDDGAADEDIHRRFFRAYNSRFNKRLVFREEPEPYVTNEDEPAFLDQIDFLEDRFSRLVRDALERNEISMSRAAEMLNISLAELRDRVAEWDLIE